MRQSCSFHATGVLVLHVLFGYHVLANMAWLVTIVTLMLNEMYAFGDLQGDAEALLAFRNAVDARNILQWNLGVNACRWEGIECSTVTPRVTSVRLPGCGLDGSIPPGSLGKLTELQALSLRFNRLSGGFPLDLANCSSLTKLYLQSNQLSGPVPSDFSVWPFLSHVDLSDNKFSGTVPQSLNNLSHLRTLFLQNNSLTGSLPALNIPTLINFSIANNQLKGSVPNTSSFRRFPKEDFSGNSLCG
eukprot:c9300_g1_i1 orf=752-1486(+)